MPISCKLKAYDICVKRFKIGADFLCKARWQEWHAIGKFNLHSDHKYLALHSRKGNSKRHKTNIGTLTNAYACAHTHTHTQTNTHAHRDAFNFYEDKSKALFTTVHRYLNLILGFQITRFLSTTIFSNECNLIIARSF